MSDRFMPKTENRWLGTADRYARLRRIETLDPKTDYREIVGLFYGDFRSIMLQQGFNGFLLTFAAPRMSRLLAETGELEHRVAKRAVDTMLMARIVMENGLEPGLGRDAARRVNAVHRQFDIHADDFVMVGCDEALAALALAENFGWREVTDKERMALRNYYDHQSRAFGSPRHLPTTIAGMREYWSHYVDTELRFEPQNLRLAEAVLGYYAALFPWPVRVFAKTLLLGSLDPRVTRACGLPVPSRPARWASQKFLSTLGKRDPVPDDAPDGFEALVAKVYPKGWRIEDLGTNSQTHARQRVNA